MPTAVFALLVLGGAAFYFMNPDERRRLLQACVAGARQGIHSATHTPADDPFAAFLRARTRWPVATALFLAFNVVALFTGAQAIDNWGNLATQTTNGESWRLLTSMFVHGGVVHGAVTLIALASAGFVLERALGTPAFGVIYLASGFVSAVVSLATAPTTTATYGASGALFGMYGLLAAAAAYALLSPPPFAIPRLHAKRIGVAALVFTLYTLGTDYLSSESEMAGLATGFFAGLVVARGVMVEKPNGRRTAVVLGATAAIAAAAVVPMRAIVDVRPELARVVAIEQRTAEAYDEAAAKFRVGHVPAKRLLQLIDSTILPELQAARVRLQELRGIAREHAPLVAAAKEYVVLREESWRHRAEGLRKGKMDLLRKAEISERAALDAFDKLRVPNKEM